MCLHITRVNTQLQLKYLVKCSQKNYTRSIKLIVNLFSHGAEGDTRMNAVQKQIKYISVDDINHIRKDIS